MTDKTELQLYDSMGYLVQPQVRIAGAVIVTGSHGGESSVRYAMEHGEVPLAIFLNDAGVGKEEAGIAGLSLLQTRDIAAATYSHESARIGETRDALEHGVITHVNVAASALDIWVGQPVSLAVQHLLKRRTQRE